MTNSRYPLILIVGLVIVSVFVQADDGTNDKETAVAAKKNELESSWNLAIRTIGGAQLWTDHLHRNGYRLQQNAVTKHWRLLDASDVRRTWGSREHCQAVLDSEHPQVDLADQPKHVVILLHGLFRTRQSMATLEQRLHDGGYPDTIRFAYASTRRSIGDSAASLRELLEDYPANTTFSFVGHSMGNIVVRHLVGDLQREGDPKGLLDRCKSMVMLGPPNQGAMISKRLAATGLYGWVAGKGGLELGPDWDELADKLGTPPFPFAIIAGDVSNIPVQNPLIDGTSDFVVSVEEADLEGRQWLKTVPVLHSFLMNDPVTMSMAIEFIAEHP